jgi:hypothetical protein
LIGTNFIYTLENPKIAAMTIIVPGAMFAAGISIYLFYEFNRVKQAKQEERRESLNDKRQQYLHHLIESRKKGTGTTDEKPITWPQEGGDDESNGT